MARIAKRYTNELEKLKENVQEAHDYFRENNERFHEFRRFLYKTTLTDDDLSALAQLERPQIEFNMAGAFVSRLRGEFSRMEPGFTIRAMDGIENVDPKLISVLEAHFRAALIDADNDGFSYDVYTDLLAGGFSVAEVYTDYVSEMSFDQNIYVERVFDPTMTGFDPLARKSHKGDGHWCFQLFPMEREEAIKVYGSDVVKGMDFARNVGGFSWSYAAAKKDIVLIADFYRKEFKREKIIKLTNGRTVTEKDYELFAQMWDEQGFIEQMPQPVGKRRETTIESIRRFRFSGSRMIDVEDTNYKMLPLVFFDGNSSMLKQNDDSCAYQFTQPYIYSLKDAQRLKNYAGQSLANELENTIEHKFMAAIEGIPEDYLDAYINVQKPSTLMYNAFLDGDSNVPLPPPSVIQRTAIPPEISGTFQLTDNLMQSILGTYDAALGINNKELSGVAIMQGAMHSNAASMPYTVGFMKGLNRVAQIMLDLIPKYYVTPRSIPTVRPDGKRSYELINTKGSPFMHYDARSLQVKVEAGVNFAVQKQISLETIIQLMQSSEIFANFINKKGLAVILDNIDIRGIDGLKQAAEQYMQELQQQEQEAQQMQQQQMQQQIDPAQLMQMQQQVEREKIQGRKEEAEIKANVDLTKIATQNATANKEADIKLVEVLAKVQDAHLDNAIQQEKVDAENARTAVQSALDVSAHHHEMEKGDSDNG